MAKKATSAELTGGGGYTFEDSCVAYYLTALVAEMSATGQEGIVSKVAVQQEAQGEPLDDIIVQFLVNGETRKLSLQAKTKVTISGAVTNSDFREIIQNSMKTLRTPGFKKDVDRYGFITQKTANKNLQNLNRIIEWAKSSTDKTEFLSRFNQGAQANQSAIDLKATINAIAMPVDEQEEWLFYRHLVGIKLDGLEAEEPTYTYLVNTLENLLVPNTSKGTALMYALWGEARHGADDARVWTRRTLLHTLKTKFSFKVSSVFAKDLEILKILYETSISEINQTIGGYHLNRISLIEDASQKSVSGKFINISGLPGCGKSVILRKLAEKAAENGPVLFIKSDNLENARSWQAYANALGISNSAKKLLQEIELIGTPTIFIDGIDRIAPDQTKIISQLLNIISNTSELENWNVVASSRDQGLEAYRTWVPNSFFEKQGITDVSVGSLSDIEAETLSKQFPALRSVLFGETQVKEIARRPFFASILVRHVSQGVKDSIAPKTESELIDIWWRQGGYDCKLGEAYLRQRALIDLAKTGAVNLGKKILAKHLAPETNTLVNDFADDRILDESKAGINWSFSHDIFFEWAFFKFLVDEGTEWTRAIKVAGEAPLLGRVVSLLSEHILETETNWGEYYDAIAANKLRKQWQRAWILGPASSPKFYEREKQFKEKLIANNYYLLPKFLVWFQAERTIPNPMILEGDHKNISNNIVLQAADLQSWPSDTKTWGRVFWWLSHNISEFGPECPLEIITFFRVWQNMYGAFENPISERILEIVEHWKDDLDLPRFDPPKEDKTYHFENLKRDESKSLRKQVAELILSASPIYPEPSRRLIEKALKADRISRTLFERIVSYAPKIAQVMPESLAELTQAYVFTELPMDKFERKQKERQDRTERVAKIKAKPESERTELEKRSLSPLYHSIGIESYTLRDIGIQQHGTFYPTAPHQEPFASLLQYAPPQGLKLIKSLCNHAILGWRQVHEINKHEERTPIPITIEFPWGTQEFWGNPQVFSWYFGNLAPNPIGVALLELTRWAHAELDKGKPVDELIKTIVSGQNCQAALGLACSIAIQSKHVSQTTMALAASQRVWVADIERLKQQHPSDLNIMGINLQSGMSPLQKTAMKELESRTFRNYSINDLAPNFAFSSIDGISETFKSKLDMFKTDLPYTYEEEAKNPHLIIHLEKQAESWKGLGDVENYQAYKNPSDTEGIIVQYEPPIEPTSEELKNIAAARKTLSDYNLMAWAMKCFETNKLIESVSLEDAITHAKSRYATGMFAVAALAGQNATQSAVIATAALVITHENDEAKLKWAWEIIKEAQHIKESEPIDRYSKPLWHPLIFVILALKSRLSQGKADNHSFEILFGYCCHDILEIAHAAFICLFQFYDRYPREVWIAVCLASDIALYHTPNYSGDTDKSHKFNRKRRQNSYKSATRSLKKDIEPKLAKIPPAWVFEIRKDRFGNNPSEASWYSPKIDLNYTVAETLFEQFPVEVICQNHVHGQKFTAFLQQLVRWTAERIYPDWKDKKDRSRNRSHNLNHWPLHLSALIARLVGHVSSSKIIKDFITPLVVSNEEDGLLFLNNISNSIVCRHIYDAKVVSTDAVRILDYCLDQFLLSKELQVDHFRAGQLHGFDFPELIKTFLFVSVSNCVGSSRFANGEWQDYPVIAPLVTKIIAACGWIPLVMNSYLKLCTNAKESIPIAAFTAHISTAMNARKIIVSDWEEYFLLTELSVLIQKRSEWAYPLETDEANALLSILDDLIDLGNRRASALIQSEAFRNLQTQT